MAEHIYVMAGCVAGAVICALVQFFVKKVLQLRQYNYFRDILLAGAWIVLAIWFGTFHSRIVVCGAALAAVLGLTENIYRDLSWRLFFPVLGALCAYFGPSVHFIRFPDGEYIYLTPFVSFVASTMWFSFFPFIFNYLDEIPGLVGHVLAVTFVLTLSACLVTGSGAFFMSFAGLVLLVAFWSRLGNVYRQAGRSLASMWGFLVAGTSIIGSSKGIVFSTILLLSLGLYALPALEIFFNFAMKLLADKPEKELGTERLYKKMLSDGLEHSEAVQYVAGLYALTSMVTAWDHRGALVLGIIVFLIFSYSKSKPAITLVRPKLWGVAFDNVSMNYAVSKSRGLILNPPSDYAQLVVTMNAIGMETAIKDQEFFEVVKNSSMVLADGAGIRLGMKILGAPIQERVAGIDFAEQLCRIAAVEGWGVYLVGAKGDTAERCAYVLKARFPGLVISGFRDGYFDVNDTSVPDIIASSGAKILLVAMGLPRQEKWIAQHRRRLGPILAVGVGGAFDVFSGKLKRAPKWVQKIGFEWLYRLIQEPGRWKKNLSLFVFMIRIFATRLGLHRK